jgi:hypothetical protein
MVAPWPVMNMTHRVNAVLHQIDDNLLQLDPVTHRRRKIGIRFGLKENMVSQCGRSYKNPYVPNQVVELHLGAFGFAFREHRANTPDHIAGSNSFPSDAVHGRPHLFKIRRAAD